MANERLDPVEQATKDASDSLQEAIDAAIATKDPSLHADYAERDQLMAARRTNALALRDVQQRIFMKEGPEVAQARARKQILDASPEQLQQFMQRAGGR